jgi:hypothetical protein
MPIKDLGIGMFRQLFKECDSRWFKPLVEQFVQSIGIFPVGFLVPLSIGEIAIMEPKALVATDKDKSVLDRHWNLDMLKHNRNALNWRFAS